MSKVRAVDFYSEKPPPRIIGTESECSLQTKINSSKLSGYISTEAIRKSGHYAVQTFLDNGFRVYVDVGFLEVDTPECLGPSQAAAADYAGILLLKSIVEHSDQEHHGLYRFTGTQIGQEKETNGYHENFLIPSGVVNHQLMDSVLVSHLTSRIWSFAGNVQKSFSLSQKIGGIADPPLARQLERQTTKKPMALLLAANIDGATIGKNPDWARVEVRFADTGFSRTNRFLSLATTSLVLRLIEHASLINKDRLENLSFIKPADTALIFSNDLTFNKTAQTQCGKNISALDYQILLATEAKSLADKIELPGDEIQAIDLWLDVCDRLKRVDLDSKKYAGLLTILDFAPRHRFLHKNFPEEIINSNNPDVVRANLIWDRLLPEGGAMRYWSTVGSQFIAEETVLGLLREPPQTRAHNRAMLIRNNRGRIEFVNWSGVSTKTGYNRLNDPYDYSY